MTQFSSIESASGRTVAVVGGGISGLTAARRLRERGARVTVLEASPKLGGQIRTISVAGHPVDVGAEAVHASAPGMSALIEELDLTEDLIKANRGTAWLWTNRGLRHLPAGVGPAGPKRLWPVLRSGVMSLRGLARAGLEPLAPRSPLAGDIGVGEFVSQRLGRQVAERLVDPLLGSLHAGDINRLSLRATAPELAAVANAGRSIVLSQRARKSGPAMSFVNWPKGLTTMIDRLSADTGSEIRTSAKVSSVTAMQDGRYQLETADGVVLEVDAVVLAVPGPIAADLIRELAPKAASLMEEMRFASVATVVAVYPLAAVSQAPALAATGLLVPSAKRRLLKAATFLSSKWPHLTDPSHVLVRLSCGRAGASEIDDLDDDALMDRLQSDLFDATGLTEKPIDFHVERWPRSIPQLEVGHLDRMKAVRDDLQRHPGLALAGASYDGLGIASCIKSGERAATLCLATVPSEPSSTPQSPTPAT